jgi:hypothetical protein
MNSPTHPFLRSNHLVGERESRTWKEGRKEGYQGGNTERKEGRISRKEGYEETQEGRKEGRKERARMKEGRTPEKEGTYVVSPVSVL